jgi:heptosyltransferase II
MTANPILCLAPRWLGDSVLARPALAELGRGSGAVHLLVRRGVERVLEDVPGVAVVHRVDAGRQARLAAASRLRGQAFAGALLLAPSFSSALAAWLAGSPVRVGFAGDGRRFLLTHVLPRRARDTHLAAHYLELVQALLAATASAPPVTVTATAGELPAMPPLVARPEEQEAAAQLLRKLGAAEQPYWVLAPGARYGPAKRWPAERFAAVAERLQAASPARIVLVGEACDAATAQAVRSAFPAALDVTGATDLGTLVGLLAAAQGVLANDSGTMHVAAALGRPVVGIFGSSNPAWTRPLGPRAVAMSNPVICSPCYRSDCNRDFACMLGLAPEAVASRLLALREAPAGPPRREETG